MGQKPSSEWQDENAIMRRQLKDRSQTIQIPPKEKFQLTLFHDHLPSIIPPKSSYFGTLSNLPVEVINIIINFVIRGSFNNTTLVSRVNKSFRQICNLIYKELCTITFQYLTQKINFEADPIFQNRWHVFYWKYRHLEEIKSYEPRIDTDPEALPENIQLGGTCEVGVCGEKGTGKSSLIRCLQALFPKYVKNPNFGSVTFKEAQKNEVGQEHIIFLVFDLHDPSSLTTLASYALEINRKRKRTTRAILVGTKSDLQPVLSAKWQNTIMEFAERYSLPFVSCSATQFINIVHLVYTIWTYPHTVLDHLVNLISLASD